MLRLRPRLSRLVEAGEDRTRSMLLALGLDADAFGSAGAEVVVSASSRGDHRRLAAVAADLILRLEPLVGAVYLDMVGAEGIAADIATRYPVEIDDVAPAEPALRLAVGRKVPGADLVVDATAWGFAVGDLVGQPAAAFPVGRLAAAAVVAGEAFKQLFTAQAPDHALARRLQPARGAFNLWDYTAVPDGPVVEPFEIDGVLVGLGGVGAGFVVALGDMADLVAGRLRLVDADHLALHNLNRVLYAPLTAAESAASKAGEAHRYLKPRLPRLDVVAVPEPYSVFKEAVGNRAARQFPLAVTGLDSDEVRSEVQRDLPRVLIDAGTGAKANCAVQRVAFLESACVGCTRMPVVVPADAACDAPPARGAPSVSFVSFFAGVGAAAEAVKTAVGHPRPDVYFEHTFLFGPRPDLAVRHAKTSSCTVRCGDPGVARAYEEKWQETALA